MSRSHRAIVTVSIAVPAASATCGPDSQFHHRHAGKTMHGVVIDIMVRASHSALGLAHWVALTSQASQN